MLIQIADILDRPTVDAMRAVVGASDAFVDGADSAGWHARPVKRNLQASEGDAVLGVLRKAESALQSNPIFHAAAQPRAFVRTTVNRYEPGMEYGTHVDAAFMDGARADISFTLFLSDPESYAGGELVIDGPDADRRVKLPAGSAVVYPATTLHRVAPVTSGVRLAVVGWVTSRVRRAEEREILFYLEIALTQLYEQTGKTPPFDRLAKVQANLLRLWGD